MQAVGCRAPKAEELAPSTEKSKSSVEPVTFEFPPVWTVVQSSPVGETRMVLKAPKSGSDTEDADVHVLYFGTGSLGDRDKQWAPWFAQFDGDAAKDATRARFEGASGWPIETFEHLGDYKLNMGPRRRGMEKSPVQVVKKNFRMIGAVVSIPQRGNWFVRIVGPNETVLANRGPFLEALRAAH